MVYEYPIEYIAKRIEFTPKGFVNSQKMLMEGDTDLDISQPRYFRNICYALCFIIHKLNYGTKKAFLIVPF
jgi:hypothetical protein